ncbi:MAG: thiol:disulfide interchange protein DsbA/DsbL [Gammaproteobacteria bacterium]|nr:thiol:disulfide interchange protein DsbA/DsbL [Gammaproteobacteria bacterium]NNC97960.1 thiol:disulfide interchange protein DsbA/DsbL [Gammaproteobacteria bacterium]NNM13777.1 thiol:disulfide interchange protein DsbA/DsbL [Gammaproteobacteria bacterium]
MQTPINSALKWRTFFLTLFLVSFTTLGCSAKEADTSNSASKTSTQAQASEDQKQAENAGATDAQDEHAGHAHDKAPDVMGDYQPVFKQAREAVLTSLASNPNDFVAGVHYDEFPARQPRVNSGEKIEVVEFFSYGCPACFNAEPYMHSYSEVLGDDVEFIRIPASFNASFEILARAFHAATALGADEAAHIAMFDAIHIKKRQDLMTSEKALANFYARYGVDKDKFLKTLNSFFVNTKIDQERKLAQTYQVSGVPTVVVNGAYRTGGRKAGSYNAWSQILAHLVEKERQLN